MARSLTITPAQLGAAAACAPLGVAAAVALSALSSAVCGAAGAAPGPGSGSRRRRATASATAPPCGGGDGSGHEEGEVGGTIGPGATVLFVITVQMGCDGGNCCPPPLPTKSCLRLRLRLG